jgi:hypothetical protein
MKKELHAAIDALHDCLMELDKMITRLEDIVLDTTIFMSKHKDHEDE